MSKLFTLLVFGVTIIMATGQVSGDDEEYTDYGDDSTTKPVSVTTKPVSVTTKPVSSTASCTKRIKWTKKAKSALSGFDTYKVFGVHAFCETGSNNKKCQHMLSVLASYIDNDNDGCSDNPSQFLNNVNSGKKTKERPQGMGAVVLRKKAGAFTEPPGFSTKFYPLLQYEDETLPKCSGTKGNANCFDASLEEIFHMLTDTGYGPTWPKVFGLYSFSNSKLTKAMDKARGGRRLTPPWNYPKNAVYKYKSTSCKYDRCQTTEYHWNSFASYTGIRSDTERCAEYIPCTLAKLKKKDTAMYNILSDTKTGYRTPKVAPTGIYTGCPVCKATTGDKTSHGGLL